MTPWRELWRVDKDRDGIITVERCEDAGGSRGETRSASTATATWLAALAP